MKGSELRKAFLEYFRSKGHEIVSSASLVPEGDPTLLFSNAGMNQFKDLFLGSETRPYKRAVTCQKCLRISGKHNDLENVGVTARHHTFFEMLGNFSFGDYFKKDAILFAWELVTEVFKLPKERLWVTIFEEDDEAGKLWGELTEIPKKRILKCDASDNFWAMGETGPCGPCSEIHVYVGDNVKTQSEADFRKGDGTYLEIWNLVFMQFNRSQDGTLTPLPKPSVDTGMGLERIASILQGVRSNYDTDFLRPIITTCEKLSGFSYDGSSFAVRDLKRDAAYAKDVAMRVIADHSRAIAFLIGDGVQPGSEGRGYVLRRLARRAIRHGRVLSFKEPFLSKTVDTAIGMFGAHYKELSAKRDFILKVVDAEEKKFYETLDGGLSILQKEAEKVKKGKKFPGDIAFLLHDTYGFPLDLTDDALKPYGLEVDSAAFQGAMEAQRSRSREDRKSQQIVFSSVKIEGPKTEFIGYSTLEGEAKLLHAFDVTKSQANLIFDATPFYSESGGQVGDTGEIIINGARLEVFDTQKIQDGYAVHACRVIEGEISESFKGKKGVLKVSKERRDRIRSNHSATHLVHEALRRVLGTHVKQAGSRVDDAGLRFDFSHFEPLSISQLKEIQDIVNEEVRNNHEVITRVLPIEEARKTGAVALFGEKYGDKVRVVEIGPKSIEFCGGTHVSRSGDIGVVLTLGDQGVSSGVRRIECVSAHGAIKAISSLEDEISSISALLKSDKEHVAEKVERLLTRNRELERELESYRGKLASNRSSDLLSRVKTSPGGVRFIVEKLDNTDVETLKEMIDTLRLRIGTGIVALGSVTDGGSYLVAGATPDLVKSINVGTLVREAAKPFGGRGGGRADFAQAGGIDSSKLSDALQTFSSLIS